VSLVAVVQGLMAAAAAGGPGVHRYWRLYITANDGSTSFMGCTELILRDALGTNVSSPGALTAPYSSSSDVNGLNAVALAFDSNTGSSGWLSATAASPQWCAVDLGATGLAGATEIKSFDLYGSWNAPSASPKDFELQWSDDGFAWTPAGVYTGQSGWTAAQLRSFSVP
jgi:hypothetical protein